MKAENGGLGDLGKILAELPDNEETRRKALLLREFLVTDENARVQIADIENGVFRDTLNADEAALAERLFNNIKNEFEINSQKDMMDLWLMVALFTKSKRFMRAESKDVAFINRLASIQKKFLDSYSQLGRELGLSRQQRLIRRVSTMDSTGSITELFAGIAQVEMATPAKRKAKKDGISNRERKQVKATTRKNAKKS